jgi:hypothetical protein
MRFAATSRRGKGRSQMVLVVFPMLLALLGFLAVRFGHDSRDDPRADERHREWRRPLVGGRADAGRADGT